MVLRKKDQARRILALLKSWIKPEDVPYVTRLAYQENNPFLVLVASVLSTRTRDETLEEVCGKLFVHLRTMQDFASASLLRLERLIYPVGFYRTKARNLKTIAGIILSKYNGVVPSSAHELTRLPGVGAKVANLVCGLAYGIPKVCVDTHVLRIANRIGLVRAKTPYECEMQLEKILDDKEEIEINTLMVAFGKKVCFPINPHCIKCILRNLCRKEGYGKKKN